MQDVLIKTDTVRFKKEKYYAASTGKTYLGALPTGYQGQFGPGVKALVLVQYYGQGVSEPKIHEFLKQAGIEISTGQVSNMVIHNQEQFHTEQAEVYEAGLRSSPWQQIDDTLTRVNGENQSCHVVCNPVYAAYFTRPSKGPLDGVGCLATRASAPVLCQCRNAGLVGAHHHGPQDAALCYRVAESRNVG